MAAADRPRVLFLCTGNSCRSQMAEGWARALHCDRIDACSAGTLPQGLNRLAVRVMAEAGVDISGHRSKRVEDLGGATIDLVITVCDSAREACPFIPNARETIHVGFEDPPRLAAAAATDDEALPHYRRVRDEIRRCIEQLPGMLKGEHAMNTGNCCGTKRPEASPADAQATREAVREGYAKIASGGCCGPGASGGGCCGVASLSASDLAKAIGYTPNELAALPEGANMGLSCGNPTALASLKPGEVVLDLGAGGGFDCFVAGKKVGERGMVIGVDMTPEMISKARANLVAYSQRTGLKNVEFRLGEIEALPVADASVDVVISNCVMNLSPDKPRVWREIARVLKPGGRVAISDLALLRPLPPMVRSSIDALIGCVAGAVLVDEIKAAAAAAGFVQVALASKPEYIRTLTASNDPLFAAITASLPPGLTPADYVTSLDIAAVKA